MVITSASHAEGREFDPRSEYFFKWFAFDSFSSLCNIEIYFFPIDLETYRVKQEKIRELEDIEQEAIERRNQPMQKASIAFLLQTDEPAEQAAC